MTNDEPMWCKHYSYCLDRIGDTPHPAGPTCALGVNIREHVGGEKFGWLARTPCVRSGLSKDVVPCDRAEMETKDVHFAEVLAEVKRLFPDD